jgi:hypothetical protein
MKYLLATLLAYTLAAINLHEYDFYYWSNTTKICTVVFILVSNLIVWLRLLWLKEQEQHNYL